MVFRLDTGMCVVMMILTLLHLSCYISISYDLYLSRRLRLCLHLRLPHPFCSSSSASPSASFLFFVVLVSSLVSRYHTECNGASMADPVRQREILHVFIHAVAARVAALYGVMLEAKSFLQVRGGHLY